jgi:hypothetical protein
MVMCDTGNRSAVSRYRAARNMLLCARISEHVCRPLQHLNQYRDCHETLKEIYLIAALRVLKPLPK